MTMRSDAARLANDGLAASLRARLLGVVQMPQALVKSQLGLESQILVGERSSLHWGEDQGR